MSYLLLNNGAAPATPASGKSSLYVSTDGRPHVLNSTGVDNVITDHELCNYVRNSGFWLAQRQTPGSLTTYSATAGRAFGADGWGVTNENASIQYRRVDTRTTPETGLQAPFYGEYTKITAAGKIVVSQVIESSDAVSLRGRTVRLTAWMKQVVGAAPVLRLGLAQLTSGGAVDTIPGTFISAFGAGGTDPTLGTNLAYIAPKAGVTGDNCNVNGNAADCTLSSAWQRFSVVFDIPTTARNLIVLVFGNAQFATTNGFAISQVMLTDGFETQDWNPLGLSLEIRRCLRFYQKTFTGDVAPAQNVGITSGALMCIAGKAAAAALAGVFTWRYPVELRGTPVVTLYNPGAANAQARRVSGAAAADQTATATANSTAAQVNITCTGDAAGTVGDQIIVHASADAEL